MKEPGYQGQKGLNRKLRKMGPRMTAVMKPRMIAVGEEARGEAIANLAGHYRTGDLADALAVKVDSRGLSVKVGYWKAGNKKRWKQAGWRAHFIEFGTKDIAAIRFLTRAFNSIRKNVARDVDRDVDKALRSIARER